MNGNPAPVPCGGCGEPVRETSEAGCPSLTQLLTGLAARHAGAIRQGVAKALKDGTAKDVLDPYRAFLEDLKQAVETAERCGLLPDSVAQVLRDSIDTALEIVKELQQIEDLPVGTMLDVLQLVGGGIGLIPGLGEPIDAIDAALSFARSDYLGAGIGLACMIPLAGIAPRVLDFLFKRGPKALSGLRALGTKSRKLLALLRKLIDRLGKYCPRSLKSYLDDLTSKIDDAIKKADEDALRRRPPNKAGDEAAGEFIDTPENLPGSGKVPAIPRPKVKFGKNALQHLRSHSDHIRRTARKLGIEIPKGPTKPATRAAMEAFIQKVVNEGAEKCGKFKDVVGAKWYKLGDAIVVLQPNGEWLSFLDYSVKSPLSGLWDSMK